MALYLKPFQEKVISELKSFFNVLVTNREAVYKLPEDMRDEYPWVHRSFNKAGITHFFDDAKNGLGEYYPRFCLKVPTGGGKTLLAVEAIREYQNIYAKRKTGLVVWIVPSETIYTQTVNKLKDKSDFYRQLLDQSSGGKTIIAEKGQVLKKQDIEENLVILFLMEQSVKKSNAKEALKVFRDSGAYDSFFPEDNRFDLHRELLNKIKNLDTFMGVESFAPQIKTSLGNIVRLTNPLIIIDEFHKIFTDLAKQTIDNLNPSMVLGLSATPKNDMNILVEITGMELKEAEMIKLDMHLYPPVVADWQQMLLELKNRRDLLEKVSVEYKKETGTYIRPIALIQAERTGKEQRGKGFVHSLDVKEYLISLGVPDYQIAIKTSSQNDIEDVNLLSSDCEIRYIITKEALKEGWDCPFAYVLGIIPNVNSNTGTTQLVGRILRQPYVKKTGVVELDESYVYFANGETHSILNQIKGGFENEGLGDLVSKVQAKDNTTAYTTIEVKIKENFKDKYQHSFYLPLLLIKTESNKYRKFNYYLDILPNLDFTNADIKTYLLDSVIPSLSDQNKLKIESIITLEAGDLSHHEISYKGKDIATTEAVDLNYLTQRLTEVIANPFKAREYAEKVKNILNDCLDEKVILENFGYLVSQVLNFYVKQRDIEEETLFKKLLSDKKVTLGVSTEKETGYMLPSKDYISVNPLLKSNYKNYLFEEIESASLNSLEESVAKTLDVQTNILWWLRNKTSKGWYAIQAWKPDKIRPDFIATRKNDRNELEMLYVIESKGKHLVGNENTEYKKKVFEMLNSQNIEEVVTASLITVKPNTNVSYEFIKEDKDTDEIRQIRVLFP